jgi:hypothetical protein
MRTLCIVAALVVTGCDNKPIDYTGDYLAGVSIACGVAAVQTPQAPAPTPTPDGECQSCSGQGWLGDGQPRADCPDCDRDKDGDLDDPLPSASPLASADTGTERGPKSQAQGMAAMPPAALGQDAPAAAQALPWRSPLLPPKFPCVVLFGDEAWALGVYESVPAKLRERYTWQREDGEKAIAVYTADDAATWVEADGLLEALE